MKPLLSFPVVVLAIFAACQPEKPKLVVQRAPLFENLGNHQLKITTSSDSAQMYFNQGLTFSYGFNHAEAARAFQYAAYLDSNCSMCYWGLALVMGPNINFPMDTSVIKTAFQASQKALQVKSKASDWEQALIDALAKRYTDDKTSERSPLDSAYAAEMRDVFSRFPGNTDIGALLAESLMDLHPWDYWNKDGTPQPWTPEILQVLEHTLAIDSLHPGANHIYIHATEASYNPQLALGSARRLGSLAPAAGHLVHMPAHTYIRTGKYHEGALANINATKADSLYEVGCHLQGVYPLAYIPHNHHFLAACATLEGDSKTAIAAAFETVKHTDHTMLKVPGLDPLQHFTTIPCNVLIKFNKWDEILNLPAPDDSIPYPMAIWHYARGMAFTGKNRLEDAEQELAALKLSAQDTNVRKVMIFFNKAGDIVDIALLDLQAALASRKGQLDKAITLLQQAVVIEDSLKYDEPPDWFFSVRHQLGGAFLDGKKYADAVRVYNEDLKTYPENGWALNGLFIALLNQNKKLEAEAVKARFEKAWEHADVKLKDSRVEAGSERVGM